MATTLTESSPVKTEFDIEAGLAALKLQLPAIIDCYLPPEAADYSMAMVSINKTVAGEAEQVMVAVWAFLNQFTDAKFVIVCDGDVNVRDWNDIIWAVTTRMDPSRDTVSIAATSTRCSKIGFDATNKIGVETDREWGTPIIKDPQIVAQVDAMWAQLAINN